jgi:hypothetical protein
MAEHISFSGTPSRVVVTELQDLLKEKLRDGQMIVIPGIGRFGLRVESIGVQNGGTACPSVSLSNSFTLGRA